MEDKVSAVSVLSIVTLLCARIGPPSNSAVTKCTEHPENLSLAAAKDKFSGCSVHLVTAELDGGPILAQSKVTIERTDTAETLSSKVLKEEHLLYPEVLLNFTYQIKGTLNFWKSK